MRDPISERLRLAVDLAAEAGRAALVHFRRAGVRVEAKPDGTPVTIADREAEAIIRLGIARAFPEDSILGEEHEEVRGSSGFQWIIDPIDGTKAFIRGVPLWGGLLAVALEGKAVVGVVDLPALGESVHAARGHGAWHVGPDGSKVPARVSASRTLASSLVCFSAFETYRETGTLPSLLRLADRAAQVRGWSDAYAHFLVAAGRADVALEPRVAPWDVAPLQVILPEAGGRFSDWQGSDSIWSGTGLSSNGAVHDETLRTLREPAG